MTCRAATGGQRARGRSTRDYHLNHARNDTLTAATRRNAALLAGEAAWTECRDAPNPFDRHADPLDLHGRYSEGLCHAAGGVPVVLESPDTAAAGSPPAFRRGGGQGAAGAGGSSPVADRAACNPGRPRPSDSRGARPRGGIPSAAYSHPDD